MPLFDVSVDQTIESVEATAEKWTKAGLFLKDTLPDWFAILPALAFALPQLFPDRTVLVGACIALAAVLLILSVMLTSFRARRLSALSREIALVRDSENAERAAFREAMEHISHRLCGSISAWTSTSRLTIYGWKCGRFFPLVRISKNTRYSKINRESYPDNEGMIAEIWTGEVEYQREWKRPSSARKEALKSGMPEEVYDELILKPQSAIGIRVDRDSLKFGIILLESDKQEEMSPDRQDQFMESDILADLKSMMIAAKELFEPFASSVDASPETDTRDDHDVV